MDDFTHNRESHCCKVSQLGKVRTVSEASARNKIAQLRKTQASIINSGGKQDEQNLDNVFTTAAKANEIYSMSMFSKADTFLEKSASQQAQQTWLKKIEASTLPIVPEETTAASPPALPDFQVPADLV